MQFNQKFLKHVAMVDTPETLKAYVAEIGIILEDAEAEDIFKQIINVRNECGYVELSDDDLEQITGGASKGKEVVQAAIIAEETIKGARGSSGACSVSGWLVDH